MHEGTESRTDASPQMARDAGKLVVSDVAALS
jgi:hypothetical protein